VANKKLDDDILEALRAETIDDDAPDLEEFDELDGRRVHCWVLLKAGKRDVNCDV